MIYSPREDSFLLEKYVKKYSAGKSFLDMGAGSGIQSKAAIKVGAKKVIASDISEEVHKSLKLLGLRVIKSNLFQKVKGKFDIIAFNPPYLPADQEEDKESELITSGGKRGDELIIRFLLKAPKYLNKDGIILLIISSLTPKDQILAIIKKQKLNVEVLEKQSFFMEIIELWKISLK